jgi:uncharacterized protein YkwD
MAEWSLTLNRRHAMSLEKVNPNRATDLGRLSQNAVDYQGSLNRRNRLNVFKLRTSGLGDYEFKLQNLEQDTSLRLLNRRGKVLQRSKNSGASQESISTDLREGTYFLKVRLNQGRATSYTLTASRFNTSNEHLANRSSMPGDGVNAEERKLYRAINRYREKNGLPSVRFSKALSTVANRHVVDLHENIGYVTHSWSDAYYNPRDPKTFPSMWEAPQRLGTGYPGYAYENVLGTRGRYTATARDALKAWKKSPTHNDLMLSRGIWRGVKWKALGVGLYKGFASIWFGEKADPTGRPDRER